MRTRVLDSYIHYVDVGGGSPIVFLHGNPTSSYIWRNIIPHLSENGRCLAPDLIGMGQSGKPDIEYRFVDHARYLDEWFDVLGLDSVMLVLHDWGSALGFHWAARHPERVSGIAFFEAILKTRRWNEVANPKKRQMFESFRTPGLGEKLLMEENFFIENWLPRGVLRDLTEEEMDVYRSPFPDSPSRLPVWRFPQEIPFDGQPADVASAVDAYGDYLSSDPVPKLMLTFEPGSIVDTSMVEWAQRNLANLQVDFCGDGVHFVQEDHPHEIGQKLTHWRTSQVLQGGDS